MAKDHPLVVEGCRKLTELEAWPAILPGLNTYTGQIIKRLFDSHELVLQVSLATNYLETIRMMASIGLGWTVLPGSMLSGTLQPLDVETETPQRQLGRYYSYMPAVLKDICTRNFERYTATL